MAPRPVQKVHLSAKALIEKARNVFKKVKEPSKGTQGMQKSISIADCLSSALAIFKLKFPSLLQFEHEKKEKHVEQNRKTLF